MEVRVICGKMGESGYEQATIEIRVNGKSRIDAYPGEGEDFSLERDLQFVYDIVPLMREAWEAGKAGEKFVVDEVEEG